MSVSFCSQPHPGRLPSSPLMPNFLDSSTTPSSFMYSSAMRSLHALARPKGSCTYQVIAQKVTKDGMFKGSCVDVFFPVGGHLLGRGVVDGAQHGVFCVVPGLLCCPTRWAAGRAFSNCCWHGVVGLGKWLM